MGMECVLANPPSALLSYNFLWVFFFLIIYYLAMPGLLLQCGDSLVTAYEISFVFIQAIKNY